RNHPLCSRWCGEWDPAQLSLSRLRICRCQGCDTASCRPGRRCRGKRCRTCHRRHSLESKRPDQNKKQDRHPSSEPPSKQSPPPSSHPQTSPEFAAGLSTSPRVTLPPANIYPDLRKRGQSAILVSPELCGLLCRDFLSL